MIIRVDPESWEGSNTVQLDSDAADNEAAMTEIEDWATEHGFSRTDECWLRRALRPDGRQVFRGICFRLMADELAAAGRESGDVEQRMRRMPVTVHGLDPA